MAHHQKRLGLEGQNLPADLAPDAAAGSGDQDGFVGEIGGDLGQVDLGRWAAQQVLHRDVAQLQAEEASFEEVLHAGQGAEPHQGITADRMISRITSPKPDGGNGVGMKQCGRLFSEDWEGGNRA